MKMQDFGPEFAVIYLRISQDRAGEQLGVERQEKECRALAQTLGLRIVGVYIDNDVSATNGRVRPEFERMLRDHPQSIIAWHQDRLLRLTSDLEKVIALGVPVHFVTAGSLDLATPAGRAVARTIAAWSQYEGEQKSLRQQSANLQRAERGHWQFSRRPYGYDRVDGQIVVVPAEADLVREGYRRYIAGESYYKIANDWNARGIATHDTRHGKSRGGPDDSGGIDVTNAADGERTKWSMTRVRSLLRNEHYAGIVSYLGERVDAPPTWEPLVDERTWSDYIETRDGRTRAGSWSTSTKHLLSGLLRCGVCGERMQARPDRGRLVYACRINWCTSIGVENVDDFAERVVLARLNDKKVIAGLRSVPDTAPVIAEIAKLRKRRSDVTDLLADGILDRRRAREQATELSERIDAATARLASMRRASPLTDLALARSIPARWARLSVLDRRRVLEDVGVRFSVSRGRPGRTGASVEARRLVDVARVSVSWTAE